MDEEAVPGVVISASHDSDSDPTTKQVLDELVGDSSSDDVGAEDKDGDGAQKDEAGSK